MTTPAEHAMRKWLQDNRPDVLAEFMHALQANPQFFASAQMMFEAGRDFQRANPTAEPHALTKAVARYNWDY